MTDKPIRVQRSRAKGWRMPENTIYVGRGRGVNFIYGNPWEGKKDGTIRLHMNDCVHGFEETSTQPAAVAASMFRLWISGDFETELLIPNTFTEFGKRMADEELSGRRKLILDHLPELRGKNLACWCALDQPCHADVLLELANAPKGE